MFFRTLTHEEDLEFRVWTRSNYRPGSKIDGAWHYVVRDEARIINAEHTSAPDADDKEAIAE